MRLLIVKLSSMGDLIHALPAITDATRCGAITQCDWVVDRSFQSVLQGHPSVNRLIISNHRQWKRAAWRAIRSGAIRQFYQQLRQYEYDLVIDLQGSLKSALITRLARGKRVGLSKQHVREYGAHWCYQQCVSVASDLHVITRWRALMASACNYQMPDSAPDFGAHWDLTKQAGFCANPPYCVFLLNTTWQTKHYPLSHWDVLCQKAAEHGYNVLLPWATESEYQTAQSLAQKYDHVSVLPRLTLDRLPAVLHYAVGVIGGDTGLSHWAAAMGVPTLGLFGPTLLSKVALVGQHVVSLVAEHFDCLGCHRRYCALSRHADPVCMGALHPGYVWKRFIALLDVAKNEASV